MFEQLLPNKNKMLQTNGEAEADRPFVSWRSMEDVRASGARREKNRTDRDGRIGASLNNGPRGESGDSRLATERVCSGKPSVRTWKNDAFL
jgi:hypothetical protein